MEKRLLFDEVPEKYDKARPKYCEELFSDIINYAKVEEGKIALEIGCGTGQALEPLLNLNMKVSAIEIGKNLAEYTKRKYADRENLEVINAAFEDYYFDNQTFDLIYSATAFHWIPEEKGYKKAYDMLKTDGAIALFWNVPSGEVDENGELHQTLEKIYDNYFPVKKQQILQGDDKLFYGKTENLLRTNGFREVEIKTYSNIRVLSSNDYVDLLDTYSDHRALPKEDKEFFYNQIRKAISDRNDEIYIENRIELYLGRK